MSVKNIEKVINDPSLGNTLTSTQLVNILKKASKAYYESEEIMNDDTYDTLYQILQKKDPENKFLKQIDTPTNNNDSVQLPFPMGSLDKIYPEDTDVLTKWKQTYKGPYVISDKMDGISMQLYKKNGSYHLYTRGHCGFYGKDKTQFMSAFLNQNNKINLDMIPDGTSIRGEIIMSKKNYNEHIPEPKKNPRTVVSGIVNSKKINEYAKYCDFITYNILHPSTYTQKEEFEKLISYGFNVAPYSITNEITSEYLEKYLRDRKKISHYNIDGIVIVDNSKPYEHIGGYPDFAKAFKIHSEDQIATTQVINVLWEEGRYGHMKPRIEIKPVVISGNTIKYITAFNAKYVLDNKLGPNAIVKIVMGGEVIPQIKEVIKPADEAQMPNVEYEWNDTGIDIINKNIENNDLVKIKKIEFFFDTMGVKFMGQGIVQKLYENKYDDIFKILNANINDLTQISGLGDKMISKIYDSIKKSFEETKLCTIMTASQIFGRGLGETKLKLITDVMPDIMSIDINDEELYNRIINIDGYAELSAKQFVDNFDKFKKFYEKLKKAKNINIVFTDNIKNKNVEQKLKGLKIVFTGIRDKELEQKIIDMGGSMSTSVSKNTKHVVCADKNSTSEKITKAKSLDIDIVTINEFKNLYQIQ